MLILTRNPGRGNQSTVCIGHDIQITIVDIQGDEVQIAVTAPPAVSVALAASSLPAPAPRPALPRPKG